MYDRSDEMKSRTESSNQRGVTKAFDGSESLRLTADSSGAFACIEGGMRTSAAQSITSYVHTHTTTWIYVPLL